MKSILVPVDFSSASENALSHAIALAKLMKTQIILLHAYHIPVPVSEAPVSIPMDEIEQASNEALIKLENRIKGVDKTIRTKLISRAGFAVDCILDIINNKEADIVVMGTKGHTNAIDIAIGSNSTTLMKKTKCPILVVPSESEFKIPSDIVLGCDYSRDIPDATINTIKYFTNLFSAKLHVLDVFGSKEQADPAKAASCVKLQNSLSALNVITHFREGENVNEELNKCIDLYKAGWVIMLPHSRSLLSEFFHKSSTKQMAIHTHVPLLSIHD